MAQFLRGALAEVMWRAAGKPEWVTRSENAPTPTETMMLQEADIFLRRLGLDPEMLASEVLDLEDPADPPKLREALRAVYSQFAPAPGRQVLEVERTCDDEK